MEEAYFIELAVRRKIEEFRTSPKNRYSALTREPDLIVQDIGDNLTSIFMVCAWAAGGKFVIHDTGKHSQEPKDLIKKRQSMKASNLRESIEVVELLKLINMIKEADIREYIMKRIECALGNGGSL